MVSHFDQSNFHTLCNQLAKEHPVFNTIIVRYGYPPLWHRPNTFETLVHVILEQQVSLSSALAALKKLQDRIEQITPSRLLLLTDQELRACYVSRQKIVYIKNLAEAILGGQLNLEQLPELPEEEIRKQLTQLKGIGTWTSDIYLMMVLNRPDVFPAGDLAVVRTMKMLMPFPPEVTRLELTAIAEAWRPYRTIATYLLWHYYLSRKLPILHASS